MFLGSNSDTSAILLRYMQPMYRINHTIVVFLLYIIFCCAKCDKDHIERYQFKDKIRLSPSQKTYSLSDTIWISFQSSSKSFRDLLSNQIIPTDTNIISYSFHYRKWAPSPIMNDTLVQEINPQNAVSNFSITSDNSGYNFFFMK